jgi:plastocyanin
MSGTAQPAATPPAIGARALIPLAVAAAVAGGIYIIAKSVTPDPTSGLFSTSGTGTFPLKSALSSGVLALAFFQLYTSLWIFGKINKRWTMPRRLGIVHRTSGVLAILLSVPIAYNCLLTYGFEDFNSRVLIHAAAGCFFYGAFAAKLVVVRSKRLPGWMLPAAGGTLITVIAVLWYTAAFWYYNDMKVPGLDEGAGASSSSGYQAPAGGASAKPTPVKGGVVQVTYKGFAIDPANITVKAGQKIKWTNEDGAIHNVITQGAGPEMIKSPDFGKAKTFEFTPSKPGTIKYLCTFHPSSMQGTITVK